MVDNELGRKNYYLFKKPDNNSFSIENVEVEINTDKNNKNATTRRITLTQKEKKTKRKYT